MLYNDYYRRMSKVMTFARAVKKHLLVILLSLFAVLAVIATLLATRGLVYDKDDCPPQVEYGQSISYTAGAFLASDVSYEYCAEGSTEWSKTPPTRAGKYYVRAVSYRTGGSPSYGKVHSVTVLPKKIDVTVGCANMLFGDKPSVEAELSYGDNIECTEFIYADLTRTVTTVSAVKESIVIKDKNGEDVTDCYEISTPTCPIMFLPREIGITVADKTAEYDNTPVGFGGYELTDGTLADGNMLVCIADTTLTEVGTVDVTAEFRVLGAGGIDVSANYDIKQNVGKISVTQRILHVASGSAEAVYDGSSLSCTDYTVDESTTLVVGHRLSLELSSSLTNAGSIENFMAFKVYDSDDNDVTTNYSVVLDKDSTGKLTVTPRDVTVKSVDKTWEYDGIAHGEAAVKSADGLVDGHSVVADIESAVITDVGTADNDITVTVHNAKGDDISSNYKITYAPGTLTVTQKVLAVSSVDGQFTYDGTEKAKNEIASVTGLVDGHKAQVDNTDGSYATITDVGTADNDITITVSADGVDKTANYKIQYTAGTLEVLQRPITVKAADVSREYDGTPFTSNDYEITSDNKLVLEHIGRATCSGERTEHGTEENLIVGFKVFDGETDVTKNYAVTFADTNGTLTVTRRVITVKSVDAEFTYDGTAKSKNEIGSVDRLLDIHTICVNKQVGAYATITDVGTADNDILTYILDADGIVVSGNYHIIHVPGTLTVTPRPVTVKSKSLTKIYDAKPLKGGSDDFEVTEGNFVLDHKGVAVCSGEQIDRGSSYNTIDKDKFTVLSGETDVTKNYSITISEEQGKLTVTPRPIKVIAVDKDIKFVYDGEEHVYTECTIVPDAPLSADDEAIVGGQTVRIIPHILFCDVRYNEQGNVRGRYNVLELIIKDGTLYNYNYNIEYDLGTITVIPRPITVKAAWATKIYDGTPLTSNEFAVTSELKIVDGQHGVASCTGSITEVGTTTNTIEHNFKVYDSEAYDVTANYDITYDDTPNPLTVEPRPITVTTHTHSFIYDGEDHDWQYFGVTPSQPRLEPNDVAIISTHHAKVDESTVTIVNEATLPVGGVSGTPNRFHIFVLDENNVDKTHNYDIIYVYNRLFVRPRPIIVHTDSQEFLYDNNDHSHVEYTTAYLLATDGDDKPIIDKHFDEVVSFTTVHDVMRNSNSVNNEVIGTDNNIVIAIKDRATSADKTYNYDILYVYGTLTVNPRPITVTTESQKFMYDDTEHDYLQYSITNRAPLKESDEGVLSVHEAEVGLYTSVRNVKRDASGNIIDYDNVIEIIISRKADHADQTHNYDIKYDYGALTVKPRPITVTTGSQEFMYDDTAHEYFEYKISNRAPLTESDEGVLSVHKDVIGWYTPVCNVMRDASGNIICCDNVLKILIERKSDGADQTHNYDIKYVYGTLTVNPRPIEITTGSQSWIFDGIYHSNTDFAANALFELKDGEAALVNGHKIWLVNRPFAVRDVKRDEDGNVIGYENNSDLKIVRDSDNVVTTDNYEITYEYGTLKITPLPVTIYTADHAWKYDGYPHSDYTVTVDESTPLVDMQYAIRSEDSVCSITEIGKKENKFNIEILGTQSYNGTNINTHNYDITLVCGYLVIEKSSGNGGGDNGNGNHGGDIGGGDLTDGDGPGGGGEPELMLTVSTNYNGLIYLRQNSYGDYVVGQKTSFLDAEEYNGLIINGEDTYGMNYLPAAILQNSVTKYYINIELTGEGCFVVPYFAAFGNNGQIQTSDVWYYLHGEDLNYSFNFYPYMYMNDNGEQLSGGVGALSGLEKDYYSFVLSKYLQIPDSTQRYLSSIISEQHFSNDDPNIISKVAQYIQNSAEYNLEYDLRLDDASDKVVAFLRDYKQGVCRHYAAAATMLFRALGIPARYVCGVTANGDGTGNPIPVMSNKAHAWTEVYIVGAGWVPVEVTGSGGTGGNGNGNGNGNGTGGDGEIKPTLTIKPIDVYVEHAPATPINAIVQVGGSVNLNNMINKQGYSYDVKIVESEPGVSEITSFKLYNFLGMDVTDMFGEDGLTFLTGLLVVTGKKTISVGLPCISQTYNGIPLKFEPDDYIVLDAPAGYTVTLDLSRVGITAAGTVTTEGLRDMLDTEYGENGWYKVLNEKKQDVTDQYFISFIGDVADADVVEELKKDTTGMTVLQVSQKRIAFTSRSKSKKYDGVPLEAEIVYSQKELAAGHTASITNVKSITDVGEIKSTFVVQIFDAEGVDVTDNYYIEYNVGTLTVTE